MKKWIACLLAAVLLSTLLLPMTALAASASASIAGPKQVRAGDTITLTFQLTGSGLFGASGTLTYDSSQVSLVGTKQKISAPWAVEFNGSNFVAYDNNLSNPIKGTKALFTATFKVKQVATGTAVQISCTNVKASDGSADANIGTVNYTAKIAAPLATNNDLAEMTVSNAEIQPAFHADTTSYKAKVPFSVSKLDVKAVAADGKATVSVYSPSLRPDGNTNVTITVKAENGAKKTYTIQVFREKDPNYKASSNNDVTDIKVEGFLLSPKFNQDQANYLVWLPYETESIKVTGKAADSKATIEVTGGDQLLAGRDNEVKVTCIAEDGSKKTYTILAKRAAAHDGTVDEVPEVSEPEPAEISSEAQETNGSQASTGIAWWWLLIVALVCLCAGGAIGFAIDRKMKK